mgnify:CR=1 FL=1
MNYHLSVLLEESFKGLQIKAGDVFFDGTVGDGGMELKICQEYGKEVLLIGTDLDREALLRAKTRIEHAGCKPQFEHANFRDIDVVLQKLGIKKINCAFFDLGMSSFEIDASGRGFSFQKREPLIMTLDDRPTEEALTAREIVNKWDEAHLVDILRGYGEERFAKRIARAIVEYRREKAIKETHELRDIIISAVPFFYRRGRINPATKTFQALRITVNDEIRSLKEALRKTFTMLQAGGRIAVISFHSIEDRTVKNYFKDLARFRDAVVLTKKPIVPSAEEVEKNPRARSAKLRIIEKRK